MTIRQQIISLTESGLSLKEAFLEVSKLRGVQIDSIRRAYSKQTRIHEKATALNVNVSDIKHGWIKDKEASFFFKNPDFNSDTVNSFKDDLIKLVESHVPKYSEIKKYNEGKKHLLVIDPADIHIGKLCSSFETGEDYDNQIAVKRVKDGVNGILSKIDGFGIQKIMFVGGNDILHIDSPKRTTTSGTPQDTCGMWYDNFLIAFKLYVEVLEQLLSVAPVHFVYNVSNHDYMNGFFLSKMVETFFINNNDITFDCDMKHRKYYAYGTNLIGTTHGDGAKNNDLALLMAHESVDWIKCKHKYFYIHHGHRKIYGDQMSVCVEMLRSPSGTDGWHSRNGFTHSPKAVEGFLHHIEFGQVARFSHYF